MKTIKRNYKNLQWINSKVFTINYSATDLSGGLKLMLVYNELWFVMHIARII